MKYEKGKKITDVSQFNKGQKYIFGGGEVFEFSHIGKSGNPYFIDEGQGYCAIEDECNCIGFLMSNFYEAIEVTTTLEEKIKELIELGKSKGLKINVTFK